MITHKGTLFGIIYKSLITSTQNGNIDEYTLDDIKRSLDLIIKDIQDVDKMNFLLCQKYEWKDNDICYTIN